MKSHEEIYHLKGKNHQERITPLVVKLFDFPLPHQAERLATHIRKLAGKDFKIIIKETRRPKTKTALGFYFGGIVRAMAMELKNLPYDPDQIVDDWREHRRAGRVDLDDVDIVDTMLRLEFHYKWIKTMDGQKVKIPKDLADKDNGILLQYISRIMDWRAENGLPYINPEEYKANRDSARMNRGYIKKEVDVEYPENNLKPKL